MMELPKGGEMFYAFLQALLLPVAKLLFRLRVEGAENIPTTGGVILAANHVSFADPLILGLAVRRPLYFVAKEELFRHRVFAWLIRSLNAFPVGREQRSAAALKKTLALLKAGEPVVIFPEGTRGDGLTFGEPKPGIGLVAKKSGAPVIPVYHQGAEKILPRGTVFPRIHPVVVCFGRPIHFPAGSREGREALDLFGQRVMGAIASLKETLERRKGVCNSSPNETTVGGATADVF